MTDDRSETERLADDEKRAYDEIHRGERARQIVEDELFTAAVEAIKDRIWDEFAKTQIDADNERRNARISLEMLQLLLKHLRHHMETGKLAKAQLTKITERKSWLAKAKERIVA